MKAELNVEVSTENTGDVSDYEMPADLIAEHLRLLEHGESDEYPIRLRSPRDWRPTAADVRRWRTRCPPVASPRPQTVPSRRATLRSPGPPSATRQPARATPTPGVAVSAASSAGLAEQPMRAVPVLARPPASSNTRVAALRDRAIDQVVGSSQASGPDATGHSSLTSRRSPRSGPTPPFDQRLRPFANALAELLLADLLKYPPRTS